MKIDEKKRIVFILPSTHAGGGNRVTITLLNGLAHRGFDVKLYVYSDEKDIRYSIDSNVEVKRWKEKYRSKFSRIFNLFEIIRYINQNHKDDTVFLTDQFSAIFANKIHCAKVYRYVQADDYNFYNDLQVLKYKIFLILYKLMTRVAYRYRKVEYIFVSKFVRDQYFKYGGLKKDWKILNPPVSSTFSELGIRNEAECNICIVARNHEGKGFSDFEKAFHLMKQSDKVDNVYVLSPDSLEKYDTNGMKVIHAKSDEEMNEYYNKSQIFISTTWNEGFGLPPLEAMSTGCACVICDNGGTREFAKDGKNCRTYEAKNSEMLAETLDDLVIKDGLRKELGKEGISTAINFGESIFADRFARLLNEI